MAAFLKLTVCYFCQVLVSYDPEAPHPLTYEGTRSFPICARCDAVGKKDARWRTPSPWR